MTEIKIEKGVPFTKETGKRQNKTKYPWHVMEVGDSFALPIGEHLKLSSNVAQVNKRYKPKVFAIRKFKDQGIIRIWRIK